MKIGYPCINRGIGCSANRTFRLASYTEDRLLATVRENLECLERILTFNRASGLLFFRITSDLVPLASHPVCTADWQGELRPLFSRVGDLARAGEFRISLHPDQFVLIQQPGPGSRATVCCRTGVPRGGAGPDGAGFHGQDPDPYRRGVRGPEGACPARNPPPMGICPPPSCQENGGIPDRISPMPGYPDTRGRIRPGLRDPSAMPGRAAEGISVPTRPVL